MCEPYCTVAHALSIPSSPSDLANLLALAPPPDLKQLPLYRWSMNCIWENDCCSRAQQVDKPGSPVAEWWQAQSWASSQSITAVTCAITTPYLIPRKRTQRAIFWNWFFFFLNQNCGYICCFPVLHIWLWLKEHLRRKQQLFLGYGFNESKGDALMARIKAIFGRVNTQAKSVQFVCGETTVKARAIIGVGRKKRDYAARWTF